MEPHGDDLVDCPYCLPPKNHQLKYKSLGLHLDKIRKSNPEIRKKKVCMFNSLHLLEDDEVDQHHATCPDRRDDVAGYGNGETSTVYEAPETDYSPPRESNRPIFRLNPNNNGLCGGHRSGVRVAQQQQSEVPRETPRLPVGMAPPSPKPAGKKAKKHKVSQSQAFNKDHLA